MSTPARVLVFAGSARVGSLNKKLARVAASSLEAAGAEATFIDLNEYTMPLYHGDLEIRQGIPENARKLRAIFIAHEALLIASPENNASVSAPLKNTLDWVSRQDGDQPGGVPYSNKIACIMAASPGALGGLRGLVHLRAILESLGVLVLPGQFALSRAHEAFDEQGALKDAKQKATVDGLARRLVEVAVNLRS